MNIFDTLPSAPSLSDWTPSELPLIASVGITEIEWDYETTGLRWWAGDLPIGGAYALPDGRTGYVPWGHRVGPNLDEATCKRWMANEFKGVHVTNHSTRFEVHMSHAWGVDWEPLGVTVSDVAHYAALLDDHRQKFSQEALCLEYLPEHERKVKVVDGHELDMSRAAYYHPGVMAVRAEGDVRQVQKLKRILLPMLEAEDLMRVKALEDKVIYVVCEMERNGAKIDVGLLDLWVEQCQAKLLALNKEIAAAIGRTYQGLLFDGGKDSEFFNPDSSKDLERLFHHLKLPIARTASGRPSFTGDILNAINHPVIHLIRRASKLTDLLSKYLLAYQKTVDRSSGILRYALHQLRAQKDPNDDATSAGTVSGRFSSTKAIDTDEHEEGLNIQQIMKPEKQIKTYGDDYIVRQLHVAADGKQYLTADAMQIEYRAFASYTGSKRILDVYDAAPAKNENGDWIAGPLASFHLMVHAMIKPYQPDLTYRRQKDLNFAKIYGAGLRKMALMLGFITAEQFRELNAEYHDGRNDLWWYKSPLMAKTIEVNNIYNREIPEAKPLLERAKELAKTRGYVRTVLGRRSRFPNGWRIHKALNCIIQGSAADVMKQKLVELHEARHDTGFLLRFTVHDEVDGDIQDLEGAQKVAAILNRQSFPQFKVPILWETSVGPNWKDTKDITEMTT